MLESLENQPDNLINACVYQRGMFTSETILSYCNLDLH